MHCSGAKVFARVQRLRIFGCSFSHFRVRNLMICSRPVTKVSRVAPHRIGRVGEGDLLRVAGVPRVLCGLHFLQRGVHHERWKRWACLGHLILLSGECGVAGIGVVLGLPDAMQVTGHDAFGVEAGSTPGVPVITGFAAVIPLDAGGPGQLQCPAAVEVHEQERCRRVDSEVPEAVEHVVAGVVRPPHVVAFQTDEPSRSAAM
jgi:hypothetical protein